MLLTLFLNGFLGADSKNWGRTGFSAFQRTLTRSHQKICSGQERDNFRQSVVVWMFWCDHLLHLTNGQRAFWNVRPVLLTDQWHCNWVRVYKYSTKNGRRMVHFYFLSLMVHHYTDQTYTIFTQRWWRKQEIPIEISDCKVQSMMLFRTHADSCSICSVAQSGFCCSFLFFWWCVCARVCSSVGSTCIWRKKMTMLNWNLD